MTIGELLKDYRISQHKTQKQWVGDVISTSFYAKVEKDLSRISAEDLMDLLHSNQIPVIDFFGKLSQKDMSIHQQELEIDRFINEAYYQNSKKELQQIRKIVAESEFPDKNDRLLLIDAYIALINNDLNGLDKNTIKQMKEKVFNITNFDIDGLSLYCNFMSFYDLDSNLFISKRAVKQNSGTSDIKVQQIVLSIIINIAVLSIQSKRPEETSFFFEIANQIKAKPEIFFYKTVISAFENIVNYQNTHDKKYLDDLEAIIKSLRLAGMEGYGKELKDLVSLDK